MKLFVCVAFVSSLFLPRAVCEAPNFRILAPPFVCPKDENTVIDKPDNTVITLRTEAGLDVKFTWIVRWCALVAPTQRFTLALWRSVRDLEKKLNQPQIEPGVYIIENSELLSGVKYTFNVTASNRDDDEEESRIFHIDNIQGDQTLLMEGRDPMFSVELIGGQLAYADIEFLMEAQVTMCVRTHDYYFVWSVKSNSGHEVNVSDVKGSRLEIPPHSLVPGLSYIVCSQLYKYSSGDFITESNLPFEVRHRDLQVHLNVDVLVISVNTPFKLHTDVSKLDFFVEGLNVTWKCTFNGEPFNTFESYEDGTLFFLEGLPDVGEYWVSTTVTVQGGSTETSARIITMALRRPTIKVHLTPRIVNEDSIVHVIADVRDMVPGCSVTWYFMSEECLLAANDTDCPDNENGAPISETLNFYSLEENFLSELTDYSNETTSKSLEADFEASDGRARVVAVCGCIEDDNCTTGNAVYADVNFKTNAKPDAREVLVSPETGTALETIFRLSTLAIVDPNPPLRYTFYCELPDNDTLLLSSYLEHLSVETMLPYIEGGTIIWVEVCDSLGACTSGLPNVVNITAGQARTVQALLDDVKAYITRCELVNLRRLAVSAVVTYTSADQIGALTIFRSSLLDSLRTIDKRCIEMKYDQYTELLQWLKRSGINIEYLQ